MAWFKREKKRMKVALPSEERHVRTEGLWIKCESCRAIIWKKDLEANWQICPKCDHHFRLGSKRRLEETEVRLTAMSEYVAEKG